MSMVEPEIEVAPVGGAGRRRTRLSISNRSTICSRALASTRRNWRGAGFSSAAAVGGLADISRLPFTEKDELRRSRTSDEPIGTHCTATRDGNRAHLFDQRHDGRAELHSAHGGRS